MLHKTVTKPPHQVVPVANSEMMLKVQVKRIKTFWKVKDIAAKSVVINL